LWISYTDRSLSPPLMWNPAHPQNAANRFPRQSIVSGAHVDA
jgi:hypothetical protein